MASCSSERDDVGLFSCTVDVSKWQAALLCYEEVVELKAAGKSKKAAKKEETLQELDEWYSIDVVLLELTSLGMWLEHLFSYTQVPDEPP